MTHCQKYFAHFGRKVSAFYPITYLVLKMFVVMAVSVFIFAMPINVFA